MDTPELKATGTRGERDLSPEAASNLRPGAGHYRAYVGPPRLWDFMGASQFRLLATLGLTASNKLLDFGCGSLRAGRLFIPYLQPGNYYGLEPNRWLIQDAIEREIGRCVVDLKRPVFRYDNDFRADHFEVSFDFILAQSIFSHAGHDLVGAALASMARCLSPDGLIVATFIYKSRRPALRSGLGFRGWLYPGCLAYDPEELVELIAGAGLVGRAIPWFHPNQTWYVMALDPRTLPDPSNDRHLSGAVLRGPRFGGVSPST
jgi:SAM-dependent methyltransferase